MHLDYQLKEDSETDWSSVTEEDLRYRVALGNLIFHVGNKDFSAAWDWIPLVDLAASFAEIVRKLEGGSASQTFEFTESDAWIRFGGKVRRCWSRLVMAKGRGRVHFMPYPRR